MLAACPTVQHENQVEGIRRHQQAIGRWTHSGQGKDSWTQRTCRHNARVVSGLALHRLLKSWDSSCLRFAWQDSPTSTESRRRRAKSSCRWAASRLQFQACGNPTEIQPCRCAVSNNCRENMCVRVCVCVCAASIVLMNSTPSSRIPVSGLDVELRPAVRAETARARLFGIPAPCVRVLFAFTFRPRSMIHWGHLNFKITGPNTVGSNQLSCNGGLLPDVYVHVEGRGKEGST